MLWCWSLPESLSSSWNWPLVSSLLRGSSPYGKSLLSCKVSALTTSPHQDHFALCSPTGTSVMMCPSIFYQVLDGACSLSPASLASTTTWSLPGLCITWGSPSRRMSHGDIAKTIGTLLVRHASIRFLPYNMPCSLLYSCVYTHIDPNCPLVNIICHKRFITYCVWVIWSVQWPLSLRSWCPVVSHFNQKLLGFTSCPSLLKWETPHWNNNTIGS